MPIRARTTSTERPHLRDDTRGAVVIIGLVMGTMVASSLYHVTTVGNAIIVRTQVQNAADAAAFGNAVLQARGMNVLVALNLIMSLVMAILVVWRVIEMLLSFAIVAVGIACALTGFACAAEAPLTRWNAWFLSKDPKVSDKIVKICAAINVAEKFVATVAPPFAVAYSSIATTHHYDDLSVSFSTSIVPKGLAQSNPLQAFNFKKIKEEVVDCFKKPTSPQDANAALRGSQSSDSSDSEAEPPSKGAKLRAIGAQVWEKTEQKRMGLLFSLPVQEDRLGKLCEQAANFFDQALPSLIAGHDVNLLGWAGSVKGKLFGMAPSLFCAPPSRGTLSLGDQNQVGNQAQARQELDKLIQKEVTDQCEQAYDAFRQLQPSERRRHKYGSSQGDFSWRKCRKDANDAAESRYKNLDDARKAQDDILKCVRPAKVWEPARNGNPFLQSFAAALHTPPAPATPPPLQPTPDPSPGPPPTPPGAAPPPTSTPAPSPSPGPAPIPTTTPSPSPPAGPPTQLIWAQAEMYFDCNQDWMDCSSNAMWRLKWKARLRRVQPISEMLGDAFASSVAARLVHGGERILGEQVYKRDPVLGTDVKYGSVTSDSRRYLETVVLNLTTSGVRAVENVVH